MRTRRPNCTWGPIGCAFDERAVRLVQRQVTAHGDGAIIGTEAPLPVPGPDQPDQQQARIVALTKALSNAPFIGTETAASAEPSQIDYRPIRLAPMPNDEVLVAAHWQMARELDCATTDFQIATFEMSQADETEHRRREVMVAAVSIDQLESHASLFRAVGLKPVAIETAPSALARVIGQSRESIGSGDSRFVVELRSTTSLLMIVRNGAPVFIRMVPMGTQHIVARVARQLFLSESQIDLLQRGIEGEVSPGQSIASALYSIRQPDQEAIRSACEGIAREIGLEVTRCIQYQNEMRPDFTEPAIGCIIGAGWLEEPIVNALNLGSGVEFKRVEDLLSPRMLEWLHQLAGHSPLDRWLLPLGLALREINGLAGNADSQQWNLLPAKTTLSDGTEGSRLSRTTLVTSLAAIGAAWLIVACIHVRILNDEILAFEQQLQPLRQKNNALTQIESDYREFLEKTRVVNAVREPIPANAILALLTQILPDEVVIRRLVLDIPAPVLISESKNTGTKNSDSVKPALMEIHGLTTDDAAIPRMVSDLTKAGLRDVQIAENWNMKGSENLLHTFQISMNIPLFGVTSNAVATGGER